MKKINVQGLGTAYLSEDINKDKINPKYFKNYFVMDVAYIRDVDGHKLYTTDYTGEEEIIKKVGVFVSKRTAKQAGFVR